MGVPIIRIANLFAHIDHARHPCPYYSQSGSVRELARHIARVVESAGHVGAHSHRAGCPGYNTAAPPVPDEGAPYATARDLAECAGCWRWPANLFWQHGGADEVFPSMAPAASGFSGTPSGKPACVFTSTATQHGGK